MIASRKGGHIFPALAIADVINREYNSDTYARVINLLDMSRSMSLLDRAGRWGDLNIKFLWRAGYVALNDYQSFFVKLYRYIMKRIIGHSGIKKEMRKIADNVGLIVSLQPEINAAAYLVKKWFAVPFHTMIMDYSAHAGWVDADIDRYYVANDHVRQQLIEYRVDADRIAVTGAPAQPGYDRISSITIEKQRRLFGLDPGIPTILLMAGYLGRMVDYIGIIDAVKRNIGDIQILVITGKNKKMHNRLISSAYRKVFAYYDVPTVHPFIHAADLVISKPGGMVIADCLTHGKPMLLVDPRGGALQELIFARLIERTGAGRHAQDAQQAGRIIKHLFDDQAELNNMAQRSRTCGQLHRTAAGTIARMITDKLQNE